MSAPPIAPATDAAEALRRLLKLIDSLHKPEDLTFDRITQFSGLAPTLDPTPPPTYSWNQNLNAVWNYGYDHWPGHGSEPDKLDFSFDPTQEYQSKSPPMTEICLLDMNKFHAALLEIGFSQIGNARASTLQNQYQRSMTYLNVAYVGESRQNISHRCLQSIQIRFRPMREDQGGKP